MTAGREQRCEQSDLPESMCAHCRGHDLDSQPDPNSRKGQGPGREPGDHHPGPFPARYWGKCAEDCGEPIEPGDAIVGSGGAGGYAHWHCAE